MPRRLRSAFLVLALVGGLAPALIGTLATQPAAAQGSPSVDTLPFTIGTPQLAQISSGGGAAQAPWNGYQGDIEAATYTSNGGGTVYPTYTPGGVTTGTTGSSTNPVEPNLAVFPGANSSTVNDAPYAAGVVGTPGTLDDYCGSGSNAVEGDQPVAAASVSRQPVGSTLPLSPAYFPHIVENADGTLTGYFDYRPKDADEAIVAGTSTDNGRTWTYDGEALEENPGYCPSADTTDDGEGHQNVVTVNGSTYMYTLPRAAGDEEGVGMIVHQFSPTEQNPLGNLPSTESVGIDPDAFVPVGTAPITVKTTSSAIIPLTSVGTPGSPEQLVTGSFIDLTQDPLGKTPVVINCAVSTSLAELTGCATTTVTGTGTVTVNAGDLIEQVIGFTTKSSDIGAIPAGPNNTLGAAGVSSLTVDPVQATVPADGYTGNQFTNPVTGGMFNNNAPERLYVDGTALYCTGANAEPTDHIENCTAGAGNPSFNIASEWEPITSDPIVPATAYETAAGDGMTNGLIAPDGIVGTLPSYPESSPSLVGADPTFVMYTTKELNYYVAGITSNASAATFGSGSFTVDSNPGMYITQDLPNATGPDTLYVGATPPSSDTTDSPTIIQMTCSTVAESTGTFSGCTVPAQYATWTYASNSYLGAPGAAVVPVATLQETGEGSTTNVAKLWKNNEDISILRVAWTTNGVTFSSAGLTNGGVISGENNCQGASPDASCTSSANSSDPSAPYDDINNPAQQTSPSNLNGYADNDTANGTGPPTGGTDAGGVSLAAEMRWVGSAGSIVDNNGIDELFLSGAWAADGDSDSFNQIFYSTSTNGEYWTVPTPVLSTDYSFAASIAQDAELANGQDDPIGISAYYSGHAYAPSVVQNPDGTLTMLFSGDRIPKSIAAAGTSLGTGSTKYTIGTTDPALDRNIITVTLQPASASLISTTTLLTSTASASTPIGTPVTYTATVTPGSTYAGPPTGTVSFATTDGVITGCGAIALSQLTPDTATCTTDYTGTVDDLVQAVYGGDSLDAASENYVTTTTTLTSSDNGNAVVGETVTYSATVADNGAVGSTSPTPAGTVDFSDSAGVITNCASESLSLVNGSEVATCSVTYTSPTSAPDQISASYLGDSATFPSGATLNESVAQANTTTVLSITPDTPAGIVVGQQVTYTATVGVVSPGSGAATGSVVLSDTGGALSGCTGLTVGNGNPESVSCTTTYGNAMTDNVMATYSGDSNFNGSASANLVEAINPASTTTSVSSSSASVVVGQPLTITATVGVVAPGSGTPTGSVTFTDSSGVISDACPSQSVSVVGGNVVATCTTTFQGALTGPDQVSATYNSDGNYATSTSSTLDVPVNEALTTTTLQASASPLVVGQSVTYTGNVGVVTPGTGSPTGTVTFDGAGGTAIIGCSAVAVADGTNSVTASCTTAYTGPGSESVMATYNSDGNYASSSANLTESVDKDATSTLLSASPDPAVTGSPTVLTATVLVSSPGASTPSGTVTFSAGTTTLCASVALVTGSNGETAACSITYSKATTNLQSITATSSGDTNETGSTSAALDLAVTKATHLTLSVSPSPAKYGQRVTIRAGGLPGAATGTVSFDLGTTQLCSMSANGPGAASCSPTSPIAPGTYNLSASYSGDTTYAPSSATTSLTVVKATTAVTLRAVPKNSAYGTVVNLVAGNLPALATGALTFTFNGSTACSTTASSPSVSCTLPGPTAVGNYPVSVTYGGDSDFTGSTASTNFVVSKAPAHFSATATPSSTSASQDVTLAANHLPALATGTVSFTWGSTLLCSATVSDGSASCSAPPGLAVHVYHVAARYSGDANFNAASATADFVVTSSSSVPPPAV